MNHEQHEEENSAESESYYSGHNRLWDRMEIRPTPGETIVLHPIPNPDGTTGFAIVSKKPYVFRWNDPDDEDGGWTEWTEVRSVPDELIEEWRDPEVVAEMFRRLGSEE